MMKKWFVWFSKMFLFLFVFWAFVLLFVVIKPDNWLFNDFVGSFVGASAFANLRLYDELKKN